MKKFYFSLLCIAAAFSLFACGSKDTPIPKSFLYIYVSGFEIDSNNYEIYTTKKFGYTPIPLTAVIKDRSGNDITEGRTAIWESSDTNIVYFSASEGNPVNLLSTETEGHAEITIICGGIKRIYYVSTLHEI